MPWRHGAPADHVAGRAGTARRTRRCPSARVAGIGEGDLDHNAGTVGAEEGEDEIGRAFTGTPGRRSDGHGEAASGSDSPSATCRSEIEFMQ